MVALAPLMLLAAAAQAAEPADAQARRTARDMLEQLLAEEDHVHHIRTYEGHDLVSLVPRGRASRSDGMCERESLTIRRAPADRLPTPGSGPIREVKAQSWFYVVTDEREQPLWALRGQDLERSCAAIAPGHYRWFTADNVDAARSAVHGLFALKAELMKPSSTRLESDCRPMRECPKPAELAARLDPLRPSGAWLHHDSCPRERWCVEVLVDNVGCGAWATQLRMDPVRIDRFRSARLGSFVGALACGEMEMEREAEAAAEGTAD